MAAIALVIAAGCDTRPTALAPSISSVTPDFVAAGSSDLTVTVKGSNFVSGSTTYSVVKWAANGSEVFLGTRFLSESELTAVISAALLRNTVTAQLWVENVDRRESDRTRSNVVSVAVRDLSSVPSSVTLTGIVTEAVSSRPIVGAAIEWVGAAEVWGDRGHGVLSDANGFYRMVAAGIDGPSTRTAIWVRASKPGFGARIEQVAIQASVTLDFQLTPEAGRGASR